MRGREVGGASALLFSLSLSLCSLDKEQALAGSSGAVSIMYACYGERKLPRLVLGPELSSSGDGEVSWKKRGGGGECGGDRARS